MKHSFFRPNQSVKGTRRTQAFVNLVIFFGFAGFVNLCHPAHPLPLRWAHRNEIIMIKKLMFSLIWLSFLPLAANAITVNSKQACEKLNGTWKPTDAKGWYYYCYVSWLPEVCEGKKGFWDSHKQRCRLDPSEKSQKDECKVRGGTWGKDQASFEHCFFDKDRIQCLAEKGEWRPMGKSLISGCVRTSRDGGKPCKKFSECEFGCLAIETKDPMAETVNTSGQCAKTSSIFGCKDYFENGRIIGACID